MALGPGWVARVSEAIDRLEELKKFFQENDSEHPKYDQHLDEYFELHEYLYSLM